MKDKYFNSCANNLSLLALDDGLVAKKKKKKNTLSKYLAKHTDFMFIYEKERQLLACNPQKDHCLI